jgi:hypothetical protein
VTIKIQLPAAIRVVKYIIIQPVLRTPFPGHRENPITSWWIMHVASVLYDVIYQVNAAQKQETFYNNLLSKLFAIQMNTSCIAGSFSF